MCSTLCEELWLDNCMVAKLGLISIHGELATVFVHSILCSFFCFIDECVVSWSLSSAGWQAGV